MSWAQIKQSINSNLRKPLNELIEENSKAVTENLSDLASSMGVNNSRAKLFTSNGTFIVPDGVETVLLTGTVAGGNGGAGGNYASPAYGGGGYYNNRGPGGAGASGILLVTW